MPVFHLNNLPKQKRIQMIGEFYDTVDSLRGRKEIRAFFKDLLTADEIAALMRRIEIAVLLSAGFSHEAIIQMLGVGTAKISKVHKCLQQDESGYKIIVRRLIESRKNRLRKMKKEEHDKLSPLKNSKKNLRHSLLANLVDTAIFKLQENNKELEKEALFFTPSASYERGTTKK